MNDSSFINYRHSKVIFNRRRLKTFIIDKEGTIFHVTSLVRGLRSIKYYQDTGGVYGLTPPFDHRYVGVTKKHIEDLLKATGAVVVDFDTILFNGKINLSQYSSLVKLKENDLFMGDLPDLDPLLKMVKLFLSEISAVGKKHLNVFKLDKFRLLNFTL